jgi:hypothetical protein
VIHRVRASFGRQCPLLCAQLKKPSISQNMPRFVVSVVWGAILSAFIFLLSAFIFLLSFSYAELKSIKMQRDSFLNGHLATQSQRSYHSQSLLPQISLCFDLPSSRCFAVQRRCAATEQKCTLGCEKGAIATSAYPVSHVNHCHMEILQCCTQPSI